MNPFLLEENRQLKDQIRQLKEQVTDLQSQLNSLKQPQQQSKPTPRPVVTCPQATGTLRAETLSVDTCVCYYDLTGKDAASIIQEGLVRNGKQVASLSYSDSDLNFYEAEQKIGSPAMQPQQILDCGLFNDKAITYVKDYAESTLEQVIKQLTTAMQKRNFCLCYPKTMVESDLQNVIHQLQNTKFCQLSIQSDEIPTENYFHHINHTISSSNSIIYILDKNSSSSNKFLTTISKLCITHNTPLYFLSSDPISFTKSLSNEQIPIHKLCGLSWKGEGLETKISTGIQVESVIKFGTIIFHCPVYSGKYYYEVTMATHGIAQLGWANDLMDNTIEGNGIGDNDHSFAYDGSRTTLFPRRLYGKPWEQGDVIGIKIDMDNEEISYSQNGEELGIAFKNFREKNEKGELLPYYPGISIGGGRTVSVNLGTSPFKFCPNDFKSVYELNPVFSSPSLSSIFEIESNYSNYDIHVPRTHAFLSHKRSSAQGVAGRIWQELKNDYNIFLDSEAQFDLHDLKLLAKHTGLFIFILSEGIFTSYWCLEELRSAIFHKRRILVLQDYQFQFPNPFPNELRDIQDFLSTADTILYMAEFFSECIKQIRKRLGMTDREIEEKLDFLSATTRKCVIDNRFAPGSGLILRKGLDMKLADYLKFLDFHFECSSISNTSLFHEERGKVPITDDDIDYLTSIAPNLKSISLYVVPESGFTDRAAKLVSERCPKVQRYLLQWDCSDLTDETFKSLGKLPDLIRLNVPCAIQITDDALKSLSNSKLELILLSSDDGITDEGIGHLPPTLRYFTSESENLTPDGVIKLVKKLPHLVDFNLEFAPLNDEVIITILTHCPHIVSINVAETEVTDKCLNTVPLPPFFKEMTIANGCPAPKVPEGKNVEIHYAKVDSEEEEENENDNEENEDKSEEEANNESETD